MDNYIVKRDNDIFFVVDKNKTWVIIFNFIKKKLDIIKDRNEIEKFCDIMV